MKSKISVIIPVYNEEKHLIRLLKHLKNKVSEIIVVDSFSTDKTKFIAKKNKCLYFNKIFKNFSEKLNFAIKKCQNNWIFEIHADEIPQKNFFIKLNKIIEDKKINSIEIIRNLKFRSKVLKYGGVFPQKQLRIWKRNSGYYKKQILDERVTINFQKKLISDLFIVDHNLTNEFELIKKHIGYAKKEALFFFKVIKKNKNKKKKIKDKILKKKFFYYNCPIFLRPFMLFLFRYLFQLGFRDGISGLVYCLIQTLIYRLIVDYYIMKKFLKIS